MTGRRVAVLAGLLSVLGLGAACSSQDSTDVRTGGISADITVTTGERGGVGYAVRLSSGTLTDVDLTGSDSLVGETPDTMVTLEKSKFLGQVVYRGRINGTDANPGEEQTVRLVRGSDDTSAPHSVVDLPAAVELSAPRAGARLSRAQEVRFEVNRAPGSFRVTWTGACLEENSAGLSFAAGDPVVIPAGSLRAAGDATASCDVTFMISRLLGGTLDPAFKGGSIHSERTVQLEVTSVA